MVEECGGAPDGFEQKQYPGSDRKDVPIRKDVPLAINTEYVDFNDYNMVSPVSPSTPTQSYRLHVVSPHHLPRTPGGSVDMPEMIESYNHSPRRGTYDRVALNRASGANDGRVTVQVALRQPSDEYDARRTQPSPHMYQVPSSLRVPRQPPVNKPAHRRSDPGSPSMKESSVSGDAARGTWQQNSPLRPGQSEAPVLRARSHDEPRVNPHASEVPHPSHLGSQSRFVSTYSREQSRPPVAREKKISFAGPKVHSYLNRARLSKQTPPPSPPRLKLSKDSTTEGHIKTPFPVSSFDSDESDDEGQKKARKFPSLSALVSQNHNKPKTEGHRGLGGLMSRVTYRFRQKIRKKTRGASVQSRTGIYRPPERFGNLLRAMNIIGFSWCQSDSGLVVGHCRISTIVRTQYVM
ncbi:hypothetical protein PG994_011526 [Apiospora phragmitis]|uniref:Uncharacterized protein n=1 Tax=Apiospora phragmitis TaxID=2905665 RepID=A0ABR1TT20_9PEZI